MIKVYKNYREYHPKRELFLRSVFFGGGCYQKIMTGRNCVIVEDFNGYVDEDLYDKSL